MSDEKKPAIVIFKSVDGVVWIPDYDGFQGAAGAVFMFTSGGEFFSFPVLRKPIVELATFEEFIKETGYDKKYTELKGN